jgi:hypothetical protein
MERRLSILFHNGYLNWPGNLERRTKPIPEPIVWLGWKGIIQVAGRKGISVTGPKNLGENQMRTLQHELRKQGIRWLREPRWSQLEHDLAVVDFRMKVEKDIVTLPTLNLNEWLPEGEFLTNTDFIEITIKDKNGHPKKIKKGIRPDSFFAITDEFRKIKGEPATQRFLLELDNSTHPNRRFGRDKVVPGTAYISSPEYKDRFQFNSGRWLVVTTGEKRMKNLMKQTEKSAGRFTWRFLFSTIPKTQANDILTDPIWRDTKRKDPISLFSTTVRR